MRREPGWPDVLHQYWRVQPDHDSGGFVVTPADDRRTPNEGAYVLADFQVMDNAVRMVNEHNRWLEQQA